MIEKIESTKRTRRYNVELSFSKIMETVSKNCINNKNNFTK